MLPFEIKADTPIETLRKAGIVPDWIARDCDLLGIRPTNLAFSAPFASLRGQIGKTAGTSATATTKNSGCTGKDPLHHPRCTRILTLCSSIPARTTSSSSANDAGRSIGFAVSALQRSLTTRRGRETEDAESNNCFRSQQSGYFLRSLKKDLLIFTNMDKTKRCMNDIPQEELIEMMRDFGRKHAATVRSSRKFLRSLGMKIDSRGYILN